MIPSSNLPLFTLALLSLPFCAMDKPLVSIPTSQSMVFPAPKKETSSNKGSLILRVGRSISGFFDTNSSATAPLSARASTTDSKEENLETLRKEFELFSGKPLWSIMVENEKTTVRIQGNSQAQYQVSCLADFKKDSGYLSRPEIAKFINRLTSKDNPIEIKDDMGPSTKNKRAKEVFKRIQKYKKDQRFKSSFYVVILNKNQEKVCVFESEIIK